MFSPDAFFPVLRDISSLLVECGIRYHVTGGLLAIHYAEPRLTQDLDLVIERAALAGNLEAFIQKVLQHGYLTSPESIRDGARSGRMFQLFHSEECLKVDLYPRELIPGQFDRAVNVSLLPDLSVPFASMPDLVASKLSWISKGSHKSRRDVRQLMRRASLDEQELAWKFAAELRLTPLFAEVLAEPDEIDA